MKIHEVELNNVRHLRHVKLDLSAPITILGGRMGVGKTTVQRAVLTAMFHAKKEDRDSLVSEYDPDSKPQAVLRLSCGGPRPTIKLSRTLTDEQGTWEEDGKALRGKRKALEKVQENLPISADAAALLLWGLQEEMSHVLTAFPQDGKKLLTDAMVRGAGPDPENFVKSLKTQFNEAKVDGTKNQGSLTQARKAADRWEDELRLAGEARVRMRELEEEFGKAKDERNRLDKERRRLDQRVEDAQRLERLLETAQQADARHAKLDGQAEEFRKLEGKIREAENARDELAEDLRVLESQLRVARDEQLVAEQRRLASQITSAQRAGERVEKIDTQLGATLRPQRGDLTLLASLKQQVLAASIEIEANGLRYRATAFSGAQRVEVFEDQEPTRTIELRADTVLEGTVGRVVLRSGGLEISASGKKDVAGHKHQIEQIQGEIRKLLARFAAEDEAALSALADEHERLKNELKDARVELNRHLADSSLDDLQTRQAEMNEERARNNVTEGDRAACAGRQLASAEELKGRTFAKTNELDRAVREMKRLQQQRPTEVELLRLTAELKAASAATEAARIGFQEADPRRREPRNEVREEVRHQLDDDRKELRRIAGEHADSGRQYDKLDARLQHEGPERPLSSVEAELDEALAALHREETLQQGRELLAERINAKTIELAAAIPEDLARRVSAHLAELSGGVYARVNLSPDLRVNSLCRGGEASQEWRPDQLSVGERTMAALTLKIAVARALAEMRHPVFIVLDDSFVNLDPDHRAATERLLLELVADGNMQVILLTCHSDWARAWHAQALDRINHIDLEEVADYYRSPVAATAD